MAKRLNIDLAFNANTSQAKQAIADLQSALSKITAMNPNMPGMDPAKIKSASAAAKELSIHLNNAFNTQTGNFDLSKLDRSLKTSSINVTELSTKLLNAGALGEQAFVKLAQTIATADRPVVSLNSKLSDMFTTLKNTARWQISSSILHGFMGAVQSAYGYAQDLNESLNNIRIVTGQTTEQMADFAEQANRAAKNLSTTTNEYAKAALIFYQQGDTGSMITEKSDVVTKMSNVTSQSTEVVSNQLTAIWNNFNKAGSESYEHFADILTALGAATASSTDEIAGGLEKFSGIAETIGLSYEYAASALATITAVSRESEDVVGTALKTIFSRIQGLKQGETLEDGTDLNKYSESLMNVGISIKDQNGQLKEMDDILDEMGAKWQTLSKDQQMALAQSVAGVRQYNQLMTLMNNWDYMQENVQVARNSEGELQKQQEIYEESWEAANDRVRASMEAIYKDLIDDEFFIDITDGFSSMIDSVDAFIDGVGGVKTLLIGISSIFLSSVANKITPALQNLKHTFSVVFKSAEEQAQLLTKEMNAGIDRVLQTQNLNTSNTVALENAKKLNEAKAKLQAVEQNLTETEKQRANAELQGIQIQQQEIQTIADKITKLHEEKEAILDVAATEELTAAGRKAYASGSSEMDSYLSSARGDLRRASTDDEVDVAVNAVTAARQAKSQYDAIKEEIISSVQEIDNAFRTMGSSLNLNPQKEQVTQLDATIKEAFGNNLIDIGKNLSQLGDEGGAGFESIRNQVDLLINSMPKAISQADDMQNALTDIFTAKTKDQMQQALEKVREALENSKIEAKDFAKILQEINPKRYAELKTNLDETSKSTKELEKRQIELNNSINGFNPQHVVSKMESFTKLASGLGSVAMAAQSVRSIFQAWSNDDISFGEKLISTFIALPMALSSAQRAFSAFNGLLGGSLIQIAQATALQSHYNAAVNSGAAATLKAHAAKMAAEGIDKAKIASSLAELAVTKNLCTEKEKEAFIEKVLSGEKEKSAIATGIETAAVKINTAAQNGNKIAKLAVAMGQGVANAVAAITAKVKGVETAAVVANTAAWYANPVMWLAIVITAAVAAIVLLVSWIVKMTTGLSASEQKLEDAKKATEAMSDAADKAKESYQTLLNTINNYDSAIEKLEGLTVGTNEFTQALLEANGYAQDLIDKYNLLPDDYYVDENGAIQFKTGVLEGAIENERENVENANAMLMGAQIEQNNAQRDIDMDKAGGGQTGFNSYEVERIYNAAMEKGFNNAAEFIQSDLMTDAEKKNLISQAMYDDIYGEEYSDYKDLMYDQQKVIDDIFNNFAESMAEYEKLLVDNKLKNEGLVKSNIINSLSDEQAYQQSDYKNYILDQILNDGNWEQAKAKASKKYENMSGDEIETEFQNALGDNYIYEDGKVYNKDEDGNKGEENENLSNLSADQMKDYLINADSIDLIEKHGVDLANKINTITQNLSDEEKAMASALLNGDFTKLSKEDMAKLQEMSPNEIRAAFPFLNMLESFEIDVDTLLTEMTNNIDEWEPPKMDLSKASSEFAEVHEIVSGLNFGDTISEEEFLKLGEDVNNYFTRMADGTYKLTGDAQEFYNLIMSKKTNQLLNDVSWAHEYGKGLAEDKARADAAIGNMNIETIGQSQFISEELSNQNDDYHGSANYGNLNDQIDFAVEMGTMTQEDANAYRAKFFGNGGDGITEAEIEQITLAAQNGVAAYHELTSEIDANNATMQSSIQAVFMSATSLEDLRAKAIQVGEAMGESGYDYQVYADGLINLGSGYDICSQEIIDYQNALISSDQKTIESAQKALEVAIQIGEAAKKYDLNAEEVKTQASLMANELNLNAEAAAKLAIQNQRMNQGVAALNENWKNWKKTLTTVNKDLGRVDKTSIDYAKALTEVNKVVKQLTGVHDDFEIPKDFYEMPGVMEDIDKAAEGDIDAINRLGLSLAEASVKGMEFNSSFINSVKSAAAEMGKVDPFAGFNSFETNKQKVITGIQDLQAAVANGAINVGNSVSSMGADWATSLNQMAMQTGMSVEEMNSLLSSMGVDAEVITEYVPQTVKVPIYRTEQTNQEYDKDGNLIAYDSKTWQTGVQEMEGVVPVAQINMGESGDRPDIKYIGNGSVAPSATSGGSGGGGSKKKTSEARKDKTDVVDRYKEVNDKLEETQRLMDKNNTLADGLWGPDKIALMKENIKLMEKENKYLQEKYDLSKKYLAEDKAALEAAAADAGINFTFNNDDNISNYTEQMTALFNQRESMLDSFGEEMDEKEQERLDEFDKKVEALKSAYELYEKTLDEKKDLEEEHLEKMLEIQEEYYNVLNEELEVKVSINESDLEVIDYYLNKISDDFYQMAEAAALMVGSLDDLASGKMGGQMAEYFDGLDIQKNYLESLDHDYNTINPETGTTYINQQQYIEGLRESRGEIINNLSAINDLDKEMLDYYANTLSMASDELDKFTSKLEHQTSVLEHYKTIMDVLGKSQDYEAMGIILEGQVTTVENELKVAEETYAFYRAQADDKRKLYEQAIAAGDQAAAELYKREWEAAEEAATEAQDNMLSKTEEWAEAMKTKLRNSLDGFADELEKALTGGSSFDYINTQMERAASLQEEYLTTTNKIYETNKLMRKAQQEIDKTTNTIAKQRLKDFIKETDQLQDKSQLSKYELEIQQAKYDLLLAEIALQEAQNAKSTVRLQRDSEGNFGYVYTADQNEIDNAEQALEDAQNNLYNIGLRSATEYVEKYNQTMSAMYDTFRELEEARFNNEISQDEYNQRMLEAQEYYYQELSNFQDLYGIALDADSRVYQDAWTSAFTGMMDSSEVWKDKVTEYSENAQTAFEDWATKVDEIAQRTGLDDISEKVKEVTNDSEELKNTILGDGKEDKGVIGALEEELNAVNALTEKYGSLRGMIQGLIKDYSGLLTAINNAEHAQAEGIENEPKTEGAPASTSDSNSKKTDETQAAAAPSLTTGSQIQVKPGTRWYEDSFGGGSSGSARGGTISYVNENGSHPYNIEGMGWIKKTDIVGYDTGGYTGSWEGSYGKLAFLHQKELILNAKDTENLLQSMDFLNNIISTIDLYSANAQLGSALMNPYINNTNTKDTLEQRVYIEASFPGVSDHNELEEAFNNLINTASQYANRK